MEEELLDKMLELEGEDFVEDCEECFLENIISVDTSTVEDSTLDINNYDTGVDMASKWIGYFSACVNSGITPDYAMTLIANEMQKEMLGMQFKHEQEIVKIQDIKLQATNL